VSAPSVPAGAVAQVRLTLTTPRPITWCSLSIDLPPSVWGRPTDVYAFSATGDQVGRGLVWEDRIDLEIRSDSGGIGQLPEVPIVVINLLALTGTAPGSATVGLSSIHPTLGNTCRDIYGYQYAVSATPTLFRTGGALSIDRVTPGGGLLPGGNKVRIAGRGFAPAATVQIDGVAVSSIAVASPQAMDVTLAAPADLTGHRVPG
jgi:hypothetical protein